MWFNTRNLVWGMRYQILGRAKWANRDRQQQEPAPTSKVGGGSQVLGSPAEAGTIKESWPPLTMPDGWGWGWGQKYPGFSAILFSSLPPVLPIGQTQLEASRLGLGKYSLQEQLLLYRVEQGKSEGWIWEWIGKWGASTVFYYKPSVIFLVQ